ncbi:hypothetical protein Acr_13g0002740 [Actinidia rufa]|uniref:Uncharacterized protein n=1 Tax=Actinidia rufa TaxID=165716 RepID=A0A7J0FJW9_9ERIC|nr:hypothetical protein Acr_13g0002740 [Actinidia rufa]
MASKERETTINDEIAKKQKLVKAVDSTKKTHQELATIDESEVPKLHQKNKAVVEPTESTVLNSENEDDHQSNIELQLEDLIGKLPDWAAYVKELMHQSEWP